MDPGPLNPHGVLVVDKPPGMSSAAAVEKVKRALRAERAGHGGTLDPLATGVLPVCLGAATKLAQYLLADDKAYEAVGVLGVETDTLDRTGRETARRDVAVTEQALRAVLARRLGTQLQTPPMYSAIKQGGRRLYDLARAGEEVERAPREIRIDRLDLVAFEPPHFTIAIACSKGTYVRSLVADIGTELGCGAHMAELRRTRSGRFAIADAVTLAQVTSGAIAGELARHLVTLVDATDLPRIEIDDALVHLVRSGVQVPATTVPCAGMDRFLLVRRGDLVAIAHVEHERLHYDRGFLPPPAKRA